MVKPFKVEYLEVAPDKDITKNVTEIKKMSRYDIDKTNSAAIILDGKYGAFITNSNGGETPILNNDFDKFRITLTKGGKEYKRVFELKTDLSQLVVTGQTIPLELFGRDRNLELVRCRGNFESPNLISFYDVIQHVANQYNAQIGTDQPFLSTKFVDPPISEERNEAPNTPKIAIDFSDKPNCREALKRIKARMNLDISRNGTGDIWSMVIEDHPTSDTMVLSVFVQGKLPGSPVIVEKTSTHKVFSIAKRHETKNATRVFVEGADGTGGNPENPHRFSSLIEEFNAHPIYDINDEYQVGIKVQLDGTHYEAISFVPIGTGVPGALFWNVITEKDVIGVYTPSPWTKDNALLVQNFFSNPENPMNVNFDSPAIIDGNTVVRESNFWRDWVLLRSNTDLLNGDAIKKHYLWLQNNDGKYESFRILVDTNLGALGGSFADNGGKDRFGRSFADSLAQWDGDEWIVIREATLGDYCSVRSEGKNYAFIHTIINSRVRHKSSAFTSGSGAVEWRDVSGAFLGNDNFHYPSSIKNVKGLFRDVDAPTGKYNDNSAIEITYEYDEEPTVSEALAGLSGFIDSISDALFPSDQVDKLLELNVYNIGWWAPIFFSPFPENTLNSISENIGHFIGGVYDVPNPKRRTGVIDLVNENYTHGGKEGMNNDESHELGEYTGVAHNLQFEILRNGSKISFQGNLEFGLYIFSSESQVWRATKTYRIHGDIDDTLEWKFSEFSIYKARTPWGIKTALSNIITPDLDIRDIFEQKKVKFAILQLERSYDDVGRYQPFNLDNFLLQFFAGTVSFVGRYDLLRFTKKPVAATPVVTTRAIIPDPIQAPNTRNLIMLESIAFAEKDLQEHPYQGFVVEDDLELDIEPDVGFYLRDSKFIKESDNGPNTQLLVMKDQYFVSDGNGTKRVFTGVERI